MDLNKFCAAINSINWNNLSCSLYYQPESVPIALTSLGYADNETKENIYQIKGIEVNLLLNAQICNDLLFSIGNNHRGTYYSAVRTALPFIIEVALYGNHMVARNCALNILIDLYYFCPDSDDYNDDLLESFVKDTIKSIILENKENLIKFAMDDDGKVNPDMLVTALEFLKIGTFELPKEPFRLIQMPNMALQKIAELVTDHICNQYPFLKTIRQLSAKG